VARLYDLDGHVVIGFTGVAEFHLSPKGIVAYVLKPAQELLLELRLLGVVLGLWLELQGLVVLHSSAAVVDDKAMAFCSSNRGGKSSLAGTLVQLGHPLLSDDILALENIDGRIAAHAGYPQMRMWSDLAQHFLGPDIDLDPVLPGHEKLRVPVGAQGLGSFCDQARPLGCLYLPARQDMTAGSGLDIVITPLPRRDALVELLRRGFVSRLAEALGGAERRLDFLANLVRQVPVYRLIYPSGFRHLERVGQELLAFQDARPEEP
jgi:hypothetical protein